MIHCVRTGLAAAALSMAGLAACAAQDVLTAEQARADLDALYEGLAAGDADLFAVTPRAVFETRRDRLAAGYDGPVELPRLHADFQTFAALARHGHTRLEGRNPGWERFVEDDGHVFPLRLRVHDGAVLVTGAPDGDDIRPGDRIQAINGEPNPIWLARLTRHISAETPQLAYALMEDAEFYYAWLEYGPQERFEITYERNGQRATTVLDAIPLEERRNLAGLEPGFSLDGREARMLSDDIAYLRPGPFLNIDATTPEEYWDPAATEAFVDFIDAAFEDFIASGADHLVLDLRDNPGGDSSYSDPVIAWFADERFRFASDFRIRVSEPAIASNQARLDAQPDGAGGVSAQFAELYAGAELGEMVSFDIPYAEPRDGERFEGEVHVLVNRHSFSNAVNAAALIQDYGFGTLYGEPTRDMATTYGAMEHFTLPHSGFTVGFPKAHIIRPNGEDRSHPVTPDVRLPVPVVRGERDEVLEALVARIEAAD